MSVSHTDICDNTKLARENALFGNYDNSLVYYQGVLQQIQKLLVSVKEPNRRDKWMQVHVYCKIFITHKLLIIVIA